MMRIQTAAGACFVLFLASANLAQAQLKQPEQFYTDGEKIGGWTKQPDGRRTSFWFAQFTKDDWSYRQQVVTIYKNQPHFAYYQDVKTRLFIGRLDLSTGGYSFLPLANRKSRIEEIPAAAFPPAGPLPTIDAMFHQPGDPAGSQSLLRRVPATAEYPQLGFSKWQSTYASPQVEGPVKAIVQFNGDRGTYTLETGNVGTLSNVAYSNLGANGFLISGVWTLGNKSGDFRFTIARENMNSFTGTWTLPLETVGYTWNGTRTE